MSVPVVAFSSSSLLCKLMVPECRCNLCAGYTHSFSLRPILRPDYRPGNSANELRHARILSNVNKEDSVLERGLPRG